SLQWNLWSVGRRTRAKVQGKIRRAGGFIVIARRGRYSGAVTRQTGESPGRTPMSAQMVLLPAFVLVGLTFAFFFWTGAGRRGALAGGGAAGGARGGGPGAPPRRIWR